MGASTIQQRSVVSQHTGARSVDSALEPHETASAVELVETRLEINRRSNPWYAKLRRLYPYPHPVVEEVVLEQAGSTFLDEWPRILVHVEDFPSMMTENLLQQHFFIIF